MAASEMCIPYPPPLQTSVGFISVVFVNFGNHRQGDNKILMIQDYEQHIYIYNRQKSNDSRENNRKAVSGEFTSSWAAMLM